MNNKKSNFLIDNLGWILLTLFFAFIILMALTNTAEGFEKGLEFLRDLI